MLSKNIKRLRENIHLTQAELAEKLNMSEDTVNLWESDSAAPEIKDLCGLADIFQVSVDTLLEHKSEYNEELLNDLDYALYGEIDDLSDDEKKEVINFVKDLKLKR